jgi:TPR repeat protein
MSAVDAGDPDAQFELGRTYFEGRAESSSSTRTGDGTFASFTPEVRRNLAAAEELLKKAADQGHEEAARLLEVVKLHTPNGVH